MGAKKFYRLRNSTNSKEIGVWEQLNVPKNYYKVENNFTILDNASEFPETAPNLENFRIKTGAKLTDVLSAEMIHSSTGLFVSSKLAKIIKNYKTSGIRFYETSLVSKGDVRTDYEFMYFIHDYYDMIDYDKSEFVDFTEDDAIVEIKEEEKRDMPGFYEPRKITLKEDIDIFRAPYDVKILISQRLKDEFGKEKITGVEIEEFTKVQFYLE